eukprot:CAMPEP_0179460712 /NCGR_PEP_ID=MMETSP0799-20121207/43666_1 /TAXON_ID=46947 /ORGANISM="Geminigera cryophila, Strain CCMP2564" /LENGTH=190 /DNA_ID=CAMNT_0021263045 /DNA_START=273 /DNA_END=843 /DNA_ORIENTATION=-
MNQIPTNDDVICVLDTIQHECTFVLSASLRLTLFPSFFLVAIDTAIAPAIFAAARFRVRNTTRKRLAADSAAKGMRHLPQLLPTTHSPTNSRVPELAGILPVAHPLPPAASNTIGAVIIMGAEDRVGLALAPLNSNTTNGQLLETRVGGDVLLNCCHSMGKLGLHGTLLLQDAERLGVLIATAAARRTTA